MIEKEEIINYLKKIEKKFSANDYNGKDSREFEIIEGKVPIMLSAPHSVNHFRNGKIKYCDLFTGSICLYLQKVTGCHLIYALNQSSSDANFDSEENSSYKRALKKYIKENNIKILFDIHGCDKEKECAVEIGTTDDKDSSLNDYKFIKDLVIYTVEDFFYNHEKNKVFVNQVFKASNINTLTNYIHRECNISTMQLEINNLLRNLYDKNNEDNVFNLIVSLEYIIGTLAKVDWNAKSHKVLKLNRARIHKPQDIAGLDYKELFKEENPENLNKIIPTYNYGISTYKGQIELVHIYDSKEINSPNNNEKNSKNIYLTNRFIELLSYNGVLQKNFSDWKQRIIGMPIVVHLYKKYDLPIGVPKIDKIANISFSQALYDKFLAYSSTYDFYVYNKYVGLKMLIDYNKANYGDKGRISRDGVALERIMIPRYYKLLLACINYPFEYLRKEEYQLMLAQLDDEVKDLCLKYYKKIPGDNYYIVNNNSSLSDEQISKISQSQENIVNNKIELLVLPKKIQTEEIKLPVLESIKNKFYSFYVGYSFVFLRCSWAAETDDNYGIVRVSSNIMMILGTEDNDKIDISYNEKTITARILTDDNCRDYIIEMPATIRKKLDMNGIGCIVKVKRNMEYNFKRHSISQGITFLGTVITVAELNCSLFIKFLLIILIFPLILWWIFNEERIKVK